MRESVRTRAMRRVVAVYYLRKVLNPITLKLAILAFGAFTFGALVHVAAIFENMTAAFDYGNISYFSYYAFMNTDIVVQALVVTATVVGFLLIRDVVRGFVPAHHTPLSHA